MSELEKRIENIESINDINQCLTRYCRALDWSDEDLLKTCFLEDGHIDYGFYVGDAKGFIPVVIEVEKNSHTWHNISNVAIELKNNKAEVESYGFTAGGEVIDNQIKDITIYLGRYHDEFTSTDQGWKISRRLYIMDATFPATSGEVMESIKGLALGVALRADSDKYRKLYQ